MSSKQIKLSTEAANVFAGEMAAALNDWIAACKTGDMDQIALASARMTGVANAARDFFAIVFGLSAKEEQLDPGAAIALASDKRVKDLLRELKGQTHGLAESHANAASKLAGVIRDGDDFGTLKVPVTNAGEKKLPN